MEWVMDTSMTLKVLTKDELMKIFQDEGGEKLLDGVTDPVKKQTITLDWFRDYTLAVQLQMKADRERHGKHQDEIKNSYMQNSNKHETTVSEALHVMMNYSDYSRRRKPPRQPGNGNNNDDDAT